MVHESSDLLESAYEPDEVGSNDDHKKATITATVFNSLCNLIGGGILSLPNASRRSSLGIGALLLVVSGLWAALAVYIIVRGFEETKKRSLAEIFAFVLYPENKESALLIQNDAKSRGSRTGRAVASLFVDITIILLNVGSLIAYARIIMNAMPPVMHQFLHASGIWTNQYFWLVLAGIIFFVLTCARRMEELKWTSIVGFATIAYIVVVVVIRYFTTRHDPIVNDAGSHEIHWFQVSTGIFPAISVMSFVYCIMYNIPVFYRELLDRTPRRMMKMTAFAIPITVVCYLAASIFGYLTFGEHVGDREAGGDITKNFPKDDVLMNIGRLGLFLHFVPVFPIIAVNVRECVHRIAAKYCCVLDIRSEEELLSQGPLVEYTSETAPRYAIVIEAAIIVVVSCFTAAVVPGISIVFEVVGCLDGISLVNIVPGIMGTILWGPSWGTPNRGMRILSICMLVYGVFCTVAGIVAFFL